MPDLGRWNGIDQLAESYLSTSPYAYVANNPVSNTDPDGRWIYEDGSMGLPPATFDLHGSQYKPSMSFSMQDGMHYNEGGGSYTPFGKTQAYVDLMTAFLNGGTGGMSNIGGTLRWWTDYEDPDPTVKGIGTLGMLKLKGNTTTDWYGPGGKGNWFFGAGAALSGIAGGLNSERMYREGIRRGLSGNYTLTGRNLSLFGKMPATEASLPISKFTKFGSLAGKASFGVGVVMDGIGVYNYYYDPSSKNKVHPAKAGLNTAIGAYGLTDAGTIPALLYFGVDAFYPGGWEGYGNDYESIQSQNADIIPGFITAPYGSQKF